MTIPSVPAPAAESNFNQLPPLVGSRPRGGGAGTSGSPGVPSSPSSFPSLRGSRLSRPRARGNCDPQPLGRPKSHPTRQPLTTADSAVATSLVAPARCFSLAGPSRPLQGRFPVPRWAWGGEKEKQGGDSSGQQGREKRKGESEGRVRSCASCYRRRLGHGPGPLRSEVL